MEPRQKEHGDFATNVALALRRDALHPRATVAEAIVAALPPAAFVRKVEVAGPGFINVFVTEEWLHDDLRRIAAEGASYGVAPRTEAARAGGVREREPDRAAARRPRAQRRARRRASPVCSMPAGWIVEREYYFNDAGGQMDRFGASVEARYLSRSGRDAEVPEDGYHGDVHRDLASRASAEQGERLARRSRPKSVWPCVRAGARRARPRTGSTRRSRGSACAFDTYVSEATLEAQGRDRRVRSNGSRDAGNAYEADGAVWFRSTEFGDDKDRVLIRIERSAHVLRRRLRVRDRQVPIAGSTT